MADVTYPVVVGAGLISFLSPCVLPLVPPYLCYIAGASLDELSTTEKLDAKTARRVSLASLFFVLGFTTVFVALGAGASVIGQVLRSHIGVLSWIAGTLIILMGLHFLGVLRIPFLYRELRVQGQSRPAGFIGAYVMGLAFAFGWTPCIGPVLASVLAVAASKESVGQGATLLAAYSFGLGLPFLVAGLAVGPFMKFMQRFRRHLGLVEKIMGAMLVLTGIMFLTGTFSNMAYWLLETFPALGELG